MKALALALLIYLACGLLVEVYYLIKGIFDKTSIVREYDSRTEAVMVVIAIIIAWPFAIYAAQLPSSDCQDEEL